MLFVNACHNRATLTLWFWHLCRGVIDGASSARVVLYQKSLHWHGLDGLVLFLQRRLLVTWAKISLAGAPPDSGDSPPSSPVWWCLGCTSGGFLSLSVPNPHLNPSLCMAWGLGKCADLEISLLTGFASQLRARWRVYAFGSGRSWKVVLT